MGSRARQNAGQPTRVLANDGFRHHYITPADKLVTLTRRASEGHGQEEEIHSAKLSWHSAALRLLQYVRDEVHRFAQHYHHMLRRKRLTEE